MSVSAPTPTVPADWEIAKTGEVCEVQNGYAFKSEFFNDKNAGLPLIRIRDVHSGRSDTFYSGPFDERYVVTDNDLLIGMDGEFRVRKWRSGKGLLNQRVCRLIPNGEPMIADFLYYSIGRPLKQIEDFTPFTTVKHISAGQIRAIELPLPPLAEQKKIAHILSTVQRAIEAQERIIQTTTELKKALMHKLFTEGLPSIDSSTGGLRHEPQKQTEIGPFPESWEVAPLGEFFQIKHGYAFDGAFFKPSGDYILMTPGHFHEEGGFRDQGEKTKFFTGEIPQDYVLDKDDLVVAMTEQKSGLLGSAAFVPEGNRYLHNQRLGLIVDLDTKRLSKRYLFHVFNLPHLRVEVAKTSTGSKVKHTSPTKLRAVKVGIPPTVDEQEEIASALSATQQKINVAANKKTQLQDLFRTFLHELMTAKTRVHKLELQTFRPA